MITKPAIGNDNINLNHPHADGLIACYIMNDTGKICSDLLRNDNDIALTNTSWVADGLQANASGEYGLIDNTGNGIVNSITGTIVFKFKSLSAFSDGVNRRLFGNSGSGLGQFYAYKNTNGFFYFSFYDTAYHYVSNKIPTFPSWDTIGHQIALVWDRSNPVFGSHKMIISVDGIYQTPFSSAGTTSWSNFVVKSPIAVLNDQVGSLFANGIMEYLYIFNTVKTEAELKDIYENPYAMFYKPNMLCNLFGSFSSGILTKQNQIFGSNAFPFGQGV